MCHQCQFASDGCDARKDRVGSMRHAPNCGDREHPTGVIRLESKPLSTKNKHQQTSRRTRANVAACCNGARVLREIER
jgi:hypothetical protein